MKIVLCNGGLGNQVFQYIFSRWLELATGDACYLNDAVFWSEKPVFSDDLLWCKENRVSLGLNLGDGRVTFVEGNRRELNFRDMQLMTKCKVNLIIGNTSFSYLAALLNENPDALYLNATGRQV